MYVPSVTGMNALQFVRYLSTAECITCQFPCGVGKLVDTKLLAYCKVKLSFEIKQSNAFPVAGHPADAAKS